MHNSEMRGIQQNKKICISGIIFSMSINSKKQTQTIFEQHESQISTTTQKSRNLGYNHKILRENKKTHTFPWGLKLRWWRTMEGFWETRWVWEWITNKTMNSKKCSRENWKVLKTVLKAQNTRFSWLYQVVCKPPGQVAKHLRDKILKNLS